MTGLRSAQSRDLNFRYKRRARAILINIAVRRQSEGCRHKEMLRRQLLQQ